MILSQDLTGDRGRLFASAASVVQKNNDHQLWIFRRRVSSKPGVISVSEVSDGLAMKSAP